jgi:DNA-binding XRE family transcriptional regulator
MTTKAKTPPVAGTARKASKVAQRQARAKQPPRNPRAVKAQSIKGLKGLGVIRLGDESRLELRDRLNLNREAFGRLVNVSVRTIATVETTARPAVKLERTYNEMYQLAQALGEVVDPAALGNWFLTPNAALGGLKPLEIVERGDTDRLWDMVYRLRSGMPG